MDIHEYTLWEVGYSGSLQDIANILEIVQWIGTNMSIDSNSLPPVYIKNII